MHVGFRLSAAAVHTLVARSIGAPYTPHLEVALDTFLPRESDRT